MHWQDVCHGYLIVMFCAVVAIRDNEPIKGLLKGKMGKGPGSDLEKCH